MVQRGRGATLVSVLAVAIAAIAIWAISLKADVGGTGYGANTAAPRFTMMTGPLGGNSNSASVLYIVDSQTTRLLAYSIDPGTKMLKLLAVRDISEDARMSYYNNDKPLPADVHSRILESGAAGSDAKAATAVKAEAPHK